jgi:hypothetical protein
MRFARLKLQPLLFCAACAWLLARPFEARGQWNGHAGDPQHTAISAVQTQPLNGIRWSTPVDLNNPSEPILIHYGSPVITQANTVVVPVRGAGGAYSIEARSGIDGALLWNRPTPFLNAPSTGGWVPSFSPTLTPSGSLYYQGIGGTVYRVDNPNSAASAPVRLSFLPDYEANESAYNSSVYISTPLTADPAGNIYFGYEVSEASGPAPGGLTSGIARIAPDGSATYTAANVASGIIGSTGLRVGTNSAPALSNDGATLYVALKGSTNYMAAVDAATLAPRNRVTISGSINDAGTSSPTVGPDGHVYLGVMPGYRWRGTLQHFSPDLSQTFAPGSFGWDITPSVVPRAMVPGYTGTSSYLLFTKYNDYRQAGGSGINKLAILDPNDVQFDPALGANVMREVLTIAGVTPDPELPYVREWCINTAAVDPFTNSILVNSEDGTLYRWDLTTNLFSESVELQAIGVLEAYTPTAIGPDGTVYAINKAVLFAVPEPGSAILSGLGALVLAARRRRIAKTQFAEDRAHARKLQR